MREIFDAMEFQMKHHSADAASCDGLHDAGVWTTAIPLLRIPGMKCPR
jgi:hypothetical protein